MQVRKIHIYMYMYTCFVLDCIEFKCLPLLRTVRKAVVKKKKARRKKKECIIVLCCPFLLAVDYLNAAFVFFSFLFFFLSL